ncbi:MAG: M2 family metallopeptidase [Thermoplasmata archaeon]
MERLGSSGGGVAEFLALAERDLLDLSVEAQRADWVYATYITPDSEALSSKAYSRLIDRTVRLVKESAAISAAGAVPSDVRKLKLLRISLPLLAPSDPKESEELTRIVAAMSGTYAKGRHRMAGSEEAIDLQALSRILTESREPSVLEDAWSGWHRVGRVIRPEFERYVSLANRGCREVGFADLGAMWRSKYDMEPDAFAKEVDRLWSEVRPFYLALHAYARRRLREQYGPDRVPERGPIPAHLLGNMWAQSWEGIYPLLAPPSSGPGFDLTRLLLGKGTSPTDMVRFAEGFFVSLGLEPLPASFWERSMLVRPKDREVVCHASAWDVDYVDDLRIKMCIEITGEDFGTIHHELGHNYYQRAYGHLPFLFRESAHDGFHEAIGDTVGLSVTPEYLVRIGLLSEAPPPSGDLGLLLERALEKIAFLPFGLAVDKWRWEVFSGAIAPSDYNRTWWDIRQQYQGITPPGARGEEEFDAGAKFHVPANVPYMRYFLAHILQFQFHRALVRTSGAKEPLHRASIYGSKDAGQRLRTALEMGQSREWPDALEALTGERRMDASALLEYFAPLRRWLDEQNRGVPLGW